MSGDFGLQTILKELCRSRRVTNLILVKEEKFKTSRSNTVGDSYVHLALKTPLEIILFGQRRYLFSEIAQNYFCCRSAIMVLRRQVSDSL